MKISFSIFSILLLLGNCSGQSEKEKGRFSHIREMSKESDFFLRKKFDYYIGKYDSLNLKLIMRTDDIEGIFVQQYVLPVLKDYPDGVNFELIYHFDTDLDEWMSGVPEFEENKNLEEVKIQLAVNSLYPEYFYDYLLWRGENYALPWDSVSSVLPLNTTTIEQLIQSNSIEKMLKENYLKAVFFKQKHEIDYKDHHHYLLLKERLLDGRYLFSTNLRKQ